jgi:DNA-binding NarL/FixJ family response regulator
MSRVLVVDDHPLVLMVLAEQARAAFSGAQVIAASGIVEGIERARESGGVDVVLLDLGLPGCAGIEAVMRMRAAFPDARMVVVSAEEERTVVLAALAAGAAGYIPKTSSAKVVAAALRLVAEGGVYVPPQAIGHGRVPTKGAGLTSRQLDVLRLLARGLANKEIARNLRIAQETVKQHARAVYAALGVRRRAQAGRAAERRGIKLDR